MLVLTRKLEESVMIGDEIEVRVLGIHGDQVRLGFSAPRNVAVFRKEVFRKGKFIHGGSHAKFWPWSGRGKREGD